MSKARAKKIKLILFDVDGVLTDGTIWLVPSSGNTSITEEKRTSVSEGGLNIASGNIVEAKGFNAHDGVGFSLARMGGIKTGIITRRNSQTVALRAHDLKLDIVYQGQMDKLQTFHKILKDFSFSAEQVAYVGDDIVDLPVMKACGLAICVPNARWEVEEASHFMTDHAGGQGAARDAIEYVLKAQGALKHSIEKYLNTH